MSGTCYDSSCSLCRKDPIAEQTYYDEICWITRCPLHNQPMIVLNRHAPQPTEEEWEHIKTIKDRLYQNLRFRGYMQSMPEHWHDHLV